MKLVVCLDDGNGILFNKRRQSKDSILRQRLLERSRGSVLWMNAYSAAQFAEMSDSIRVNEDFLSKAGEGEYCFVENLDVAPFADRINQVIVYKWNRKYPADTRFPMELFTSRWKLIESTEFAGSSHERITEEVYIL